MQCMPCQWVEQFTVGVHMTFAMNKHPLLPAGKYIKIAIADKGIGIPKEIVPKIFDPFLQQKVKDMDWDWLQAASNNSTS